MILVANDIGYRIRVNSVQYVEVAIGEEAEFYIHHHIREDASDLYGFKTLADLEMYELLLTVSGVGPKSALGISSVASAEELRSAIVMGDHSILTKVSGIGKKTAERVVLELGDKIQKTIGDRPLDAASGGMISSNDELDALIALGYSLQQAREVLKKIDPKLKDSGERIKAALRLIA